MNTLQLVRSWKDDEYKHDLNETAQSLLSDNPAGTVELSDEDLLGVAGGSDVSIILTIVISIEITIKYCTRGCR